MIHVRLRCGEHRLLHRCPLRNLLINNTVYVSGRTSLCRGGVRRDGGSEWRMEMEMEMEEKKEGGVTQFSRELIEHDSNKNKLLGPSVWAVTGSVEQNFSVTRQGQTPSLIFFFLAAVAWSHGPARLCSARLGSARLCGLTPSFNLLHNVPPHWREEKNKCCFCLCTSALCIFWRTCTLIVVVCVCNPASVLRLPGPPLALNNTSRHAVRDQLTLKLLDFTLKSPSAADERSVLQTVLLIYAQTLPEGTWWCWGKRGLSYGTHVHPITELLWGFFSPRANERRGNLKTHRLTSAQGRCLVVLFEKKTRPNSNNASVELAVARGINFLLIFVQTKHHPLKSVCAGD